jgi:hypothetical protein
MKAKEEETYLLLLLAWRRALANAPMEDSLVLRLLTFLGAAVGVTPSFRAQRI